MEDSLKAFGKLNDAVIIEIGYFFPGYNEDGSCKKVKVIIDCMDTSQNWMRIALNFVGVSKFFLEEGNSTNQIIDEIKIEMLPSGEYLFDFSQGDFVGDSYKSDFYLFFSNMSVSVIEKL